MTSSAPTPREKRAARQAATSRLLAASLDRNGVTRAELAAKAGVPDQHAREWADPEANRNLTLADAATAPHLVRVELAEHILGPGWCACVLPPIDRVVDDVRHAASIARGGGVVLERYLDAIADGHIDRAEAADIRARVREQLRALASLDAGLELVEQQLGAPVKRLRVAGGSSR